MERETLGEMMKNIYEEMLQVYEDEDLAAVATADFINKYIKQQGID